MSDTSEALPVLIEDNGSASAPATPRLEHIALERLLPDAGQPRQLYDEATLSGLARSLQEQGQQNPLVVYREGTEYRIKSGHRRFLAAHLAELDTLLCVVEEAPSEDALRLRQLHESIHQRGLHTLERAIALARIKAKTNTSNRELAARTAMSQPWVSQVLGVVKKLYSEILQDVLQRSEIPGGMDLLIQISKLDHTLQRDLWKEFKAGRLTRAQLLKEIKKCKRGTRVSRSGRRPRGRQVGRQTVIVRFDDGLEPAENLRAVLRILRDDFRIGADAIVTATRDIFGTEVPDDSASKSGDKPRHEAA